MQGICPRSPLIAHRDDLPNYFPAPQLSPTPCVTKIFRTILNIKQNAEKRRGILVDRSLVIVAVAVAVAVAVVVGVVVAIVVVVVVVVVAVVLMVAAAAVVVKLVAVVIACVAVIVVTVIPHARALCFFCTNILHAYGSEYINILCSKGWSPPA